MVNVVIEEFLHINQLHKNVYHFDILLFFLGGPSITTMGSITLSIQVWPKNLDISLSIIITLDHLGILLGCPWPTMIQVIPHRSQIFKVPYINIIHTIVHSEL